MALWCFPLPNALYMRLCPYSYYRTKTKFYFNSLKDGERLQIFMVPSNGICNETLSSLNLNIYGVNIKKKPLQIDLVLDLSMIAVL